MPKSTANNNANAPEGARTATATASMTRPAPATPISPAADATAAVVLSSGGVDSTTCLALALERFPRDKVTTVSVFYGQRHARELEAARAVAAHYGVAHRELNLASVLADSDNALMANSTRAVPHESYGEQVRDSRNGLVETYVPFRNGLMLSAVAALGLSLYPSDHTALYLGAHMDDAAGDAYPDCSPEFTETMGRAISLGTAGLVSVCAPFVAMDKAQVVACGLALHVPYELTWSCYEGGDKPCGTCGTCVDRLRAFHANGVEDPVEYA